MFEQETPQNIQLEQAILKMITFFDLFSYPLTAWEIKRYLDDRFSLLSILRVLKSSSTIVSQDGFYFLLGRQENIVTRQKRHNYSQAKLKIAHRFSRLFSWCPTLRMIALANSIGQNNLRRESDLDFFIITSPGRIWLSRLYCTGLAKILNSRPTARNKQDKVCLSFYLASDRLNLTDLKLKDGDPYFEYWQRSLILLYNKNETYEKFLAANSPDFLEKLPSPLLEKRPRNFLGSGLENLARRLQLMIMPEALKQKMNQGQGVVINDQILKLYLVDRRQEFFDKYEEKLQQFFPSGR